MESLAGELENCQMEAPVHPNNILKRGLLQLWYLQLSYFAYDGKRRNPVSRKKCPNSLPVPGHFKFLD